MKKCIACIVMLSLALVGCAPLEQVEESTTLQTMAETSTEQTTTETLTEHAGETSEIGETDEASITETTEVTEGTEVGDIAIDFTLKNLAGEDVSLSDYRGKTVILNFFATWCGPCKAETADLNAVYMDQKDDDVVVLSVNLTSSEQKGADSVTAFVEEHGVTFPVLLDVENLVSSTYNVGAIPTNYFINDQGIIAFVRPGALDEETFLAYLSYAKEN